jgi:hypothetical protein
MNEIPHDEFKNAQGHPAFHCLIDFHLQKHEVKSNFTTIIFNTK